jgi:hypothetical protein
MSMKQMLRAIRVGMRSRLFICILVVVTAYLFCLNHNPTISLFSILGVLVTSEFMIHEDVS